MRKVLRYEDNEAYWDRRWSEAGHDAKRFTNLSVYPIKYAEMVMTGFTGRALELGAGVGRVLTPCDYQGHRMAGIERSGVAVDRIKAADPAVDIRQGDVRELPYATGEFDAILAFGLYHNLEEDVEGALAESARVLKPGGAFCISMRP